MEFVFSELESKFAEIYKKGWIKSINKNYNGVGLTFEELLGKNIDDFAYPDFQGIEIKAQRVKSDYSVTLFGAAPWGESWPETERLRVKYGYFDYDKDDDKKINIELYYSKNVLVCNRYFFNLEINREEKKIYLVIRDINYNLLERSVYWFFDDLESKLKEKLHIWVLFMLRVQKKMNMNILNILS
ncbi:MAG: hypothetical protein E7167_00575 [Firmicutes bacterium]|nr:hypothetical protein [Bacillota bacterium]